MNLLAVQAAWIVPVSSSPIQNGWLVACDGRIEFVGRELPQKYAGVHQVVLHDYAVLPGFFNLHCHLELSDLLQPFPYTDSFIGWIGAVVSHRRSIPREEWSYHHASSVSAGIRESYATGTRWVLDTITSPLANEVVQNTLESLGRESGYRECLLQDRPYHYTPCPEVIDINETRRNETLEVARSFRSGAWRVLSQAANSNDASRISWVSPHAPYTTSLAMVECLVGDRSNGENAVTAATTWGETSKAGLGASRLGVSMHLAESRQEIDWLIGGGGPIDVALQAFRDGSFEANLQRLRDASVVRGVQTTQCFLDACLDAQLAIIAHGNYLSNDELRLLASNSDRAAIVHCPRTYRHFHPNSGDEYPLVERCTAGVEHFFGTDSRASNPDLDIWREAKTVVQKSPEFAVQAIEMLTSRPARMLGMETLGSLQVGNSSLCTAIHLGDERHGSPAKLITGASTGKLAKADDVWQELFQDQTRALPLEVALDLQAFC